MRITFTQTPHEEFAAFAATAHAKVTGDVGVCMATSGPRAIRLLMGALAAGDENRGRIIRESIKGKLHEFTTR